MLHSLYQQFLRSSVTRKPIRKLRAKLLEGLRLQDAITDLNRVVSVGGASLFLDIGCHDGATIERAIEAGISIPIHGFDPVRENLESASKRLEKHPQVQLHELALCDQVGELTFHVNRNVQTSSLLENDRGNIESFSDQVIETDSRKVPTTTLDHWLETHSIKGERIVIKADIQGGEGLLLKGATNALSNQVIAFYGEVLLAPMYKGQASLDELCQFLEPFDMVLHYLYPCLRDVNGRAVQCDALWVKRDVLKRLGRK